MTMQRTAVTPVNAHGEPEPTERRRPLLATSTKMNLTASEAYDYFRVLRPLLADVTKCDLAVLPPFTALSVARDVLAGSNVAWGAQDMHAEDAGAHTGDISAPMLLDLGCSLVELGHAERRRDHAETDEVIAAKVAQALRHGLIPILCVGEAVRTRPDAALRHVIGQLATALAPAGQRRNWVVVAYEPVWAIGAVEPAETGRVAAVLSGIHDWLRSPSGGAQDLRVIYGGSVAFDSARALLDAGGVDGLFVGRAALDPRRFASIAAIVEEWVNRRDGRAEADASLPTHGGPDGSDRRALQCS